MTITALPALLERLERPLLARWGAAQYSAACMAAAFLVWPIIEFIGASALASVHPMQLVWLRYAVHLGLLLALGAIRPDLVLLRTKHPFVQLGRSLLMLFMPLVWVMSAARMPMPSVMAIFWLNPLIAVVGATVLLREWPRRVDVALLGIGFIAVLLVLDPVVPTHLGGPTLALAMATCFGLYLVGTRWLRREPTSVNLFHSALGVFCALAPAMPFIWRWPSVRAWMAVLVVGALGLALLFFLDRALHHATVARIAPIGFLQPLFETLLFGSLFAGSGSRTVGLLTIACVVVLCVLGGRHATTKPS